MNAEHYVDKLDSPMKEIARELRKIIINYSSDLNEAIKWNVPTYSINNKNICSIMAHKAHVNFQIFRGAHIKDVRELQGTGKDMRHIKFMNIGDVKRTDVEKYLGQAIGLDLKSRAPQHNALGLKAVSRL